MRVLVGEFILSQKSEEYLLEINFKGTLSKCFLYNKLIIIEKLN